MGDPRWAGAAYDELEQTVTTEHSAEVVPPPVAASPDDVDAETDSIPVLMGPPATRVVVPPPPPLSRALKEPVPNFPPRDESAPLSREIPRIGPLSREIPRVGPLSRETPRVGPLSREIPRVAASRPVPPVAPVSRETARVATSGSRAVPRLAGEQPRAARELVSEPGMMRRRHAHRGWQATVRRLSFGALSPTPGASERAEIGEMNLVRSQFSGPKTVVVANPKGGSAKTVTALGLAATFGDIRGGNVLAWDNNETLGTLGLRVPAVQNPATAVDLLQQIDRFEHRAARRGDLAGLVRPQETNFHVLASDEDPRRMSLIDAVAFGRLHEVLTRYYEVLIVDTGNNPRSPNFLGAVGVADSLVIPMAWSADQVLQAARLVDQLHQMGRSDLVSRAITVVSGPWGTQTTRTDVATWREWFSQTAAVIEIPTDRHLAGGGPLDREQLARSTRRAYLAAAAAVAAQFAATSQFGARKD